MVSVIEECLVFHPLRSPRCTNTGRAEVDEDPDMSVDWWEETDDVTSSGDGGDGDVEEESEMEE
jgi:hypothetical protein